MSYVVILMSFQNIYSINYGRFPFNGLTGQTRIIFSVSIKYLAKMDLILMLSKFSGQIGPKPKCFVFGLAMLMESALRDY
jgi:hypothetical protein